MPAPEPTAPGEPTAIALGVWPDGSPLLSVLSFDGVFVYDARSARIAGSASAAGWARVAKPHAPLVRALAVARPVVDEAAERVDRSPLRDEARVVWSDGDGIRSATVVRTRRHRLLAATTEVEQPDLIVESAAGFGPRFPLLSLGTRDGTLDVLWSQDGSALTHTAHRSSQPPSVPEQLTPPGDGPGPDRMQVLDVLADGPDTAWLACLTEAAELFVARWDLRFGRFGRWSRLPDPFRTPSSAPAIAACALARIASAPMVVAADRAGRLASADLRSAAHGRCVWRSVDLPAGARPAAIRALAAADGGGRSWLAAATDAGLWLTRLGGGRSAPVCGAAILVPVKPAAAVVGS